MRVDRQRRAQVQPGIAVMLNADGRESLFIEDRIIAVADHRPRRPRRQPERPDIIGRQAGDIGRAAQQAQSFVHAARRAIPRIDIAVRRRDGQRIDRPQRDRSFDALRPRAANIAIGSGGEGDLIARVTLERRDGDGHATIVEALIETDVIAFRPLGR